MLQCRGAALLVKKRKEKKRNAFNFHLSQIVIYIVKPEFTYQNHCQPSHFGSSFQLTLHKCISNIQPQDFCFVQYHY